MNINKMADEKIRAILGNKAEEIVKTLESISPDFAHYAININYGDIYRRAGFSDKNRELAAVACLIGLSNVGLPLNAHLNAMLNVGWNKEDIIELIIFLSMYAGFPACISALITLKQVLSERTPQKKQYSGIDK